jgi:cell division septum initiation protein DivIVA
VTAEEPHHDQPLPPLPGHVLDMIEQLMIDVENARQVPLSNSVMVSREDTLDTLARVQKELPEELRAARWMVREREAYIARTNEKAREVIAGAKHRSDELVSESYIVQEAVEEANTLVRNAEGEARRIRLEAEDFAERHLAEAEQVLGELLRYVREARAELHQALPPSPEPPISQ